MQFTAGSVLNVHTVHTRIRAQQRMSGKRWLLLAICGLLPLWWAYEMTYMAELDGPLRVFYFVILGVFLWAFVKVFQQWFRRPPNIKAALGPLLDRVDI